MGSQNVTNFAKVNMDRIRKAVKPYATEVPDAGQAWTAAATAIGPLTKTHPFVKTLSGKGVENALDLLISLAEDLRRAKETKGLERVLQKHNVDPKVQKPLLRLTAEMTKSLSDRLSSRQEESDSAFAGKDAISKTVIDVLAMSMPRDKVDSASPQQISNAFKKVGPREVAEIFFRNVFSSLVGLALDASRVPQPIIERVIRDTKDEAGLAVGVSQEMMKLVPKELTQIPAEFEKRRKRSKSRKLVLKPKPPIGDKPGGVIAGGK
jgi:hypothetical protein